MRRWNGWGDDSIVYPLHDSAANYLKNLIGPGQSVPDIPMEALLVKIPPARLPDHPLVTCESSDRLLHARGQSIPDWLAMRNYLCLSIPDGVAYPETAAQVRQLLSWAYHDQVCLIPYGGGTSVVGHINPLGDDRPVLTVDMCRMNGLIHLDAVSMQATFGAGIIGPDLEAHLRAHGFTLGHYPQSFEYSTLGGWIATRSSGQQSLRYGRIEKLFAGGVMETPLGSLELPSFPASAAGPDLRELVLGSEGRLGIITEATVRLTALPQKEDFHAVFFPDFEHGMVAVRQILASGISLCMLRLSTANETGTTLALAGHETLIGTLEKLLAIRGLGTDKCCCWASPARETWCTPTATLPWRSPADTVACMSVKLSAHNGIRTASAHPICATPCGTWATPLTPSKLPPAGARSLKPSPPSSKRFTPPWSLMLNDAMSSPTSPISTPMVRASIPPMSSAWHLTRQKPLSDGRHLKKLPARQSSPRAAPSATSMG
jgi:hypothetical protein